ncbi:ABC-type antimicrobial peptide transport system permease subunit [Pseudomonas lini]|uniref:ABC transporter permease n=1 Tax=Pseudomonas lini TaxID=163011 RepID=UPI002789564C|nr:ABC transporter permease [Pseudomonas lini]MDQ0121865.1 ABC-type antimicrobial peptide transport system permease subunit [Pseudomonas lini]
MNMLMRHVLRSVLVIRYRLLTIALICASTFGVLVGAYSAIDSLFDTVEDIQSHASMADLEVIFAPDDLINLPAFDDITGVTATHHRLLMPGLAPLGGIQPVAGLMVSADAADFSAVNRLKVLQGRLPNASDVRGIALERNCAKFHAKGVGDRFDFIAGAARYPVEVIGIVESPEYLVAPLNPSVYVPSNGSLCVLFADQGLMHQQLGFSAINSLLFSVSPQASISEVKQRITERAQSRLAVDYVLPRQEQFSQKFLELDLNTFKVFLPTVVLVFALSSTLVVFFLMYQWAKEERPLIAMFLTLGYTRRQVACAYSLPALMLIALALVLGCGLALFDMYAFGWNYARAIGMPEPQLMFKPPYLWRAGLLLCCTVALGMYLPMRSIVRITPMDALRDVGAGQEQAFALRMVACLRHIGGPFWFRYSLRNLLRSWRISLVTVLAMAASVAITIAFYISLTSMERTAISNVERDNWSRVVDLDVPWWDEDIGRLEGLASGSRWSTFVKGGAQVVGEGHLDNASLLGIEPADSVRHVNLMEGRMLFDGDLDALVIERRIAIAHDVHPGDRLNLKVRGNIYPAKVVGVFSGALPGEVITTRRFAQQMLSLDEQFTGAYLVDAGNSGLDDARIYELAGVVRVTSKQNIVASILEISSHIWVIIHISALMSIAIALLFAVTSMNFSIVGRRGEYGVLRILGFSDRSVSLIMLCETFSVALLAGVVAIPLGYVLGAVLNHRLTDVWFKINTDPAFSDFWRVILPALVIIPFAAMPAIRHVFRIPAVDTLKLRNFG